jgi:integrase
MPYKFQLTWVPHANRWRKRYLGKTYYLKTPASGKKDRQSYVAALKEWERLKAFLDDLGPSPYTRTGALIPESQVVNSQPYFPPAPPPVPLEPTPAAVVNGRNGHSRPTPSRPTPSRLPDDPSWILSRGIFPSLHPEAVIDAGSTDYSERRIEALADFYLTERRKEAERGDLSLKQWAEDKTKLQVFRDFIRANYPTLAFIDEIDPALLNVYRDKQRNLLDAKKPISKHTLKKRLDGLVKWLRWLVDQNILAELPKDLARFSRVRLDKPQPLFYMADEIKQLTAKATERTKLYIMLALNLGYTQADIATLEGSMIDWESGIVTRDRHKTGVPTKAKLWPSPLKLLQKHCNKHGKLLLVDQNGTPLLAQNVNEKENLIVNDTIGRAFKRLRANVLPNDSRSFKHLRKTAANEIERVAPHLTSLFLGHSEKETKRYYVQQSFDELFRVTDSLEESFGFRPPAICLTPSSELVY